MTPLSAETQAALQGIYLRLNAEIRATGVVCEASGRCCNFHEWDHTPFASTLELRNMLSSFARSEADLDDTLCPYWRDRLCTARETRPLSCRVFYCDSDYQERWAQQLYERYHKEIEALSQHVEGDAHAYLPMVKALSRQVRESRWYDPSRPWK